jgi:chemosensory pili system protein ChpA (sensor histidine kinase/response regulator)
VHGTLRMVELYAPAMVAEEMERLAHALVVPQGAKGAVADRDEACGALMRGVVLLPDYLERLQGGHKDIPIVLLPLLNELRAARGETGLSESVLFVPNLDRPLPDSLPAPMPLPRQSRQLMAAQQLTALREALATWPEDGAPRTSAASRRPSTACWKAPTTKPRAACCGSPPRWPPRCATARCRPTRALRQAFSGVEREARHVFEGEAAASVRVDPAPNPTRQLLYHVAHNEQAHGALDALRDTVRPRGATADRVRTRARPRQPQRTQPRAARHGRRRDQGRPAARQGRAGPAPAHQADRRGRPASAGGSAEPHRRHARHDGPGRRAQRRAAAARCDARHRLGRTPADEGALLDIAGALLYVDASLDDQVDRLGRAGDEADDRSRRIAQGARRPRARSDRQLRRCAPGLRRLRRNQLGPRSSSPTCRACSRKSPARCACSNCRSRPNT